MLAQIQFGDNWVKVKDSVFYLPPHAVKVLRQRVEALEREGIPVDPNEIELYAKLLTLVKPANEEEAERYYIIMDTPRDEEKLKELIDRIYANKTNAVVREL